MEKLYNSKLLDKLRQDNKVTVVWLAWKFKMPIPAARKVLMQIIEDFPEYEFNASEGAIIKKALQDGSYKTHNPDPST